jgi:hypothetical protein
MNGNLNGDNRDGNISVFRGEGYVDVQQDHAALEYTSPVKSNHAYPIKTNISFNYKNVSSKSFSLVSKRTNGECSYSHDSIDRIYLYNQENDFAPIVLGMVVDEMTYSGADHIPVFMDFTFGVTSLPEPEPDPDPMPEPKEVITVQVTDSNRTRTLVVLKNTTLRELYEIYMAPGASFDEDSENYQWYINGVAVYSGDTVLQDGQTIERRLTVEWTERY